jgi:hypothetical protein
MKKVLLQLKKIIIQVFIDTFSTFTWRLVVAVVIMYSIGFLTLTSLGVGR